MAMVTCSGMCTSDSSRVASMMLAEYIYCGSLCGFFNISALYLAAYFFARIAWIFYYMAVKSKACTLRWGWQGM